LYTARSRGCGERGVKTIDIDARRLLSDLRQLASFGKLGTGVDRPAFSDADVAARRWLEQRMREAGLQAGIDRFGNVFGRTPDARKAVLIGSHTDSVPKGGWLDGALGVIYGLEIARACIEQQSAAAVDVISFQDEEGRYLPLLGVKSFCGVLDEQSAAQARGSAPRPLSEALAVAGFSAPLARLDRARHLAYLEAHIEQGPKLEAAGKRIGVVTGIVGIRRVRITARGQADHAGTTPMSMRKDAGAQLIRLAKKILDAFAAMAAADTVWNIGVLELQPGAANVVPALASMMVEFRDMDAALLERMLGALRELVAQASRGTVAVELEETARIAPAPMDARLGALIGQASRSHGEEPLVLQSGAGHDAMVMSGALPSAMLFIPSIGGRSHDIAEDTTEDDIVLGCRVLAAAVEKLMA
jgi:beta-ureidopropionase / N-carbamoyl-L-amino-acid hydrolase